MNQNFETKLVIGQTDEHEGDFLDLAVARGVDYTVLPELGRSIRPINDVRALLRLYGLMRRDRPVIVHTHTAKAGALGRVAARLARVPIVVHTYHGHVLTGYFHPLVNAFLRAIERALASVTDALLTVSESVKDDLVRLGVATAERIRVLPLGLDLQPLAGHLPRGILRNEAGWSSEARVVAIIGRLVPIKDIDTFINAAAMLEQSTDDVRFAVVGDGEERARLEVRARTTLGDRVHFFGWRKDMTAVLGDVDVTVNTSLNEGTPVAVIEALAAGRRVVATAVGGTPDVLDRGAFGALVPSRAPKEVARAVRVALDSAAAGRMASAGQAAMLRRYSVDRLLDDMGQLYRELLARGPR